jgi:glyoxylase-like metal-dependent hydrolase (beta-lactamase superfamily II)
MTSFNFSRLAAQALTLALLAPLAASAQQAPQARTLPDFVPVLPAIKAKALDIPAKGYLVKQVKPDVYVVTDGAYQSVFVTTGKGVVLFDAPPTFAANLQKAVAEVTREPIVELVYSHSHLDHISGAEILNKQIKGLRILAEEGTASLLREKRDPRRPVPTQTFRGHYQLKLGTLQAELKRSDWHSPAGDLFIYLPKRKFLMAVDTVVAGHVPFLDFDLSTNMHSYLKVFDEVLAYDFDVLVAGHLTYLAGRADVEETREYAFDVYHTIKRIHDGTDQMAVATSAAGKYGWDNKFALYRTVLDGMIDSCTAEVSARWIDRLAAVDVFGASHCRAALIYARWDD